MDSSKLKEGHYWYREKYSNPPPWNVCWVHNGYVHFFGQISQKLGCDYLNRYVEFGEPLKPYEQST